MAKKHARPRTGRAERRAIERRLKRADADVDRVLVELPGGSADHPLSIESASLVEVRAVREPCPRCGGESELTDHRALVVRQRRLREARLRCRQCQKERSIWFALPGSIVH
jgi:ribosomal protein S27AE